MLRRYVVFLLTSVISTFFIIRPSWCHVCLLIKTCAIFFGTISIGTPKSLKQYAPYHWYNEHYLCFTINIESERELTGLAYSLFTDVSGLVRYCLVHKQPRSTGLELVLTIYL